MDLLFIYVKAMGDSLPGYNMISYQGLCYNWNSVYNFFPYLQIINIKVFTLSISH